jgi:hypothetical protein
MACCTVVLVFVKRAVNVGIPLRIVSEPHWEGSIDPLWHYIQTDAAEAPGILQAESNIPHAVVAGAGTGIVAILVVVDNHLIAGLVGITADFRGLDLDAVGKGIQDARARTDKPRLSLCPQDYHEQQYESKQDVLHKNSLHYKSMTVM